MGQSAVSAPGRRLGATRRVSNDDRWFLQPAGFDLLHNFDGFVALAPEPRGEQPVSIPGAAEQKDVRIFRQAGEDLRACAFHWKQFDSVGYHVSLCEIGRAGAVPIAIMSVILNSKIPSGPVAMKWTKYRQEMRLVNPANKRKFDIIVVGTGLAGASAAATLGELGYNVKAFCFQDSARRAHSIAAQGGINAAKNYRNDGDSIYRLFYDTIKGGDFRSREANVHRLAEVSVD